MKQELDLSGLRCPEPVIRTKNTLDKLERGVLEVTVDNPTARDNILRFARFKKFDAEVIREDGGKFVLRITKGEPPIAEEKPEAPEPKTKTGRVVLITTEGIGDDNRALALELMGTFLDVLTQASNLPAKVIFLNAGVRLTTEGSPHLDAIKDLEDAGVEIMSCGRCLEYLGLKDKLKVGRVTNMFEVMETILSAESVVKL